MVRHDRAGAPGPLKEAFSGPEVAVRHDRHVRRRCSLAGISATPRAYHAGAKWQRVVSPVFLASLVTVLPAMVILGILLKRYEGFFDEAKMFFALIVGLFAGLVVAAFEFYTQFMSLADPGAPGWVTAFAFAVFGYAFFESGIKAVFLGLGRFRTRKDTPYYGMALGLAIGAMVAMMIIANALRAGEANGTPYGWATGLLMALIPAGGMIAHGATGAWVGQGSAEGKLWKGWGIATLLQAPVLLLYWFWWPFMGAGSLPAGFFALIAPLSVVYGVALLWLAQRKVLEQIVPKDMRDMELRRRRRAKRQAARDAETEESRSEQGHREND